MLSRPLPRLLPLTPLAALLLSGCFDPFGFFGPARLKVSEIEITTEVPGLDDVVVRKLIDYDSQNRVAEIEERQGDSRRTWELSYDGNTVSEIDFRGPNNDRVSVEFDIENDKIVGGERTGEDFDSTFEVEYFNNDRKFLKRMVINADLSELFGTDVLVEAETVFSYEGANLSKATTDNVTLVEGEPSSDTRTVQELKYDGDNRISRIDTETDEGGDTDPVFQTYTVEYNDDGTVDEVEDRDADDEDVFSVKYDEDGRVEEVEHVVGDTVITTVYSYDEGSSAGLFFSLDAPVPADLRGKAQSAVGADVASFPLTFVSR